MKLFDKLITPEVFMETLWALVANSSNAQIFEIKGHGHSITKVHHIDHPDGRKKPAEINTDRQGHGSSHVGSHTHSLAPEVDTHSREQENFAHALAKELEKAYGEKAFQELALVAPAPFLGKLKQAFGDGLKKSVSKEVSKDLPETLSEDEIVKHLTRYLDLWNR